MSALSRPNGQGQAPPLQKFRVPSAILERISVMRKLSSFACLLTLALAGSSACAKGAGASSSVEPAATAVTAAAAAEQDRTGVTPQSFVQVAEGADLSARLEAAGRRARADNVRTPYWTAYTFDVRPGVAVDPWSGGTFHGSMNGYGGIYVFSGTDESGRTVETRNLGVFLLREPSGGAVTRMEIYNLDRRREYSNYPVYMTGRANNEESLNYLRGVIEAAPATASNSAHKAGLLNERASLALALHDDPRVNALLKGFVRSSRNQKIRSNSVFWLGQLGGETAFLAELVRNGSEQIQLRKHAAHALGESRDRAALSTLQSLFESVTERELRKSIVHAAGENEDKAGALAFLLRVAKSDPEREVRKTAVHAIGETGGESALDELMRIYAGEADLEIKKTVIHALGEMSENKSARAEAKLFEIARDAGAQQELRKQAIHQLAERNTDAVVTELIKLYDTDRTREVRRQILHALGESKNARAEDKLFEIARASDDADARRTAIHMIGEKVGRRALELLRETVESNTAETQVQTQAVHAIGERPAEESVPLLIKIAKTHANQQVRRTAVHLLGESGDPRALEFFREVLSKEKE